MAAEKLLKQVLDVVELMYIENLTLKDELRRHVNESAMKQMIADARKSPAVKKKLDALFRPIRTALSEEVRLEEVIRELLKASPPRWEN
jgi:hypothetical protein